VRQRLVAGGGGRRHAFGALAAILFALAVAVDAPRADVDRFVPWNRAETPALTLKDLSGRPHALADYRGKVLLVNFWATWCEPCKDEMPSIRTLKERLAGQPFEVLVVNYGEAAPKVREFLAREKLDFIALLDPGKDVARAWRVRVLPGSYLVDTDGTVRYGVIGEFDWASEDAVKVVRGLLPATATPGARGGR
jgi:thiol-disulfide isomerase/thioredoxin